MIGTGLLFITWLTNNTFSKRTPFLLLYSLFTIPKNYLLPAKRKVSYMSGKLSMSVLYWIYSNHLHSYCIHCKRRGMQRCHVFLNCCHVEKMTEIRTWIDDLRDWTGWKRYEHIKRAAERRDLHGTLVATHSIGYNNERIQLLLK